MVAIRKLKRQVEYQTLRDIMRDPEMEGYRQKAPGNTEAVAIDAETCCESACDYCGNPGMGYMPYIRQGSYRAVAICPKCDYAVEF